MRIRKALGYLALLVFCLVMGLLAMPVVDSLVGYDRSVNTPLALTANIAVNFLLGMLFEAIDRRRGGLLALICVVVAIVPTSLVPFAAGYRAINIGFMAGVLHATAAMVWGAICYALASKIVREFRKA